MGAPTCKTYGIANFSEVPRRIKLGPFTVLYFRTSPSQNIGRHAHATSTIGYVTHGSGAKSYKKGELSYTIAPGSVEIEPAHLEHSDPIGPEGLQGYVIELGDSVFQRWPDMRQRLQQPRHITTGPICALYRKLIAELGYEDATSGLAGEGLILEMLATIARAGPARRDGRGVPRWISDAKEYLEAQTLHTPQLSELARELRLHPAHLARTFRRHVGLSVGGYLRDVRMRLAKDLLKGSMPLVEIALELGFVDQSHFTRSFRKTVGCTPLEYRRGRRSARP